MPTYDYKCNRCNYRFEAFQSIVSEPVKICPRCGGESIERLISGGVGIIFKGSGFYETDYKRKSSGDDHKHPKGVKVEPAETTSAEKD